MDASSLCAPALVYLVLAVISFLFVLTKMSAMSLIIKAFFVLLWTWFLNYLCSKGHIGIAWFLVVIPYILMALIFLFAIDVIANSVGKQHAAVAAVAVPATKKEGFYYTRK